MGVTKFVWDRVFDCVTHELDENNDVKAVYHDCQCDLQSVVRDSFLFRCPSFRSCCRQQVKDFSFNSQLLKCNFNDSHRGFVVIAIDNLCSRSNTL